MKINFFNIKEFIDLNKLQEITSPILFQRGGVPHPDGLLSNEIFGVTTKTRKSTYAYISLHEHFIHPHIYKAIRRMFRNIDRIVDGSMFYSLDKNNRLVVDEVNGRTGLSFLYEVWDKINWTKEDANSASKTMRDERIDIVKNKKDIVFMEYQVVIPVFYRDIKTEGGTTSETDDINNLYVKLIRNVNLIKNQSLFDFQFHNTNYQIQTLLIDIYDYFKRKIEKKKGILRRYLMGKSVDYCSRTVITAPTYHAETPDDLFVDFRHTAIPLAQICSLVYPFVLRYVKSFFEREIIDKQNQKLLYDPVKKEVIGEMEIINPESYFSDKYIKKHIDSFIKDPETRFDKIEVPTKSKQKIYLALSGKNLGNASSAELAQTISRPMTWTDLLYLACSDATKDKVVMVTRYPVNDDFGLFFTNIRVASTAKTMPLLINGTVYKYYPVVDFNAPVSMIHNLFIDATQFSNSYLDGIEGDYDGDQTTLKIPFSQESNMELKNIINNKSYFINDSGNNIRKVGNEATQTFYVMTKDDYDEKNKLPLDAVEYFTKLKKEDLTFSNIVKWLSNTTDIRNPDNKEGNKFNKSAYNTYDSLILTKENCPTLVKDAPIKTTLGRLIINKIFLEFCGLNKHIEYINYPITKQKFGAIEAIISKLLLEDTIDVDTMVNYINMRDWYGLQVHGLITSSFTRKVLTLPKEVKELKKKLLKEHEKEIADGNTKIVDEIEKTLIAETNKIVQGDVGMDLYNSGARGSVGTQMKNVLISRGAIQNPTTKKYEIVTNSLMDGLDIKDIGTHSNMIVSGAYPKACGTQVSGYMSKELSAAFQSEVLGPKGSDCGTKLLLKATLTDGNYKSFLYRYIVDGGKIVKLTNENKSKYVGKEVKLRSPMYCKGVGKNRCLCNICTGDFNYMINKLNIGLTVNKAATTITQMNLQKFHQNAVKIRQFNVDDMII